VAVVTGWGAVSSLGRGAAELWRALDAGRDGMTDIRRFSTQDFGVKIAALVPTHNHEAAGRTPSADLCVDYALDAAREAWNHARLDETDASRQRVALVMGTSPGADLVRVCELTERIADELDVQGPRLTVSTACASSTNALGLALDLLDAGAADVVIAGGADVLTPMMFAGFHALGVLSPEKCGPFSERYGTTLGEGAGFLIVEKRERAAARGVDARAVLSGYGLSGDAFHETGPDPTGSGVARAIRGALSHAGIGPAEVDYVNAHGTGTQANDPAEWRALQSVLGERANGVPTSSTKSVLGHAQAAAGVLETIATLLCMERGVLPQTLHLSSRRANCPSDPIAQTTPRPGTFRHAVCTNSAFGGANAAVVITAPGAVEPAARSRRQVHVGGVGIGTFDREGDRVAGLDLAGLDPSSRCLAAAAARALEDSGLRRVRGELRDQTGLVCGINVVSPASIRDLRQSIEERGLPLLSATAFSRMVLNAPAGTCSKLFSLRGPLSTVTVGPGSGLFAIVYAASMVESRDDVQLMLAAGVDEPDDPEPNGHPPDCGAACAVLSAAPSPSFSVRLAGWAISGPEGLSEAIDRALQSAGLARSSIDREFGASPVTAISHEKAYGAAVSSAADFVRATQWLRSRDGKAALVVAGGGRSACCAAVLEGVPS
jgi:3-oxoacyl-[acyl-carrier-protein] synthase II